MEAHKKYRYPGLKPFSVEEQNIFFGRDEDIDRLCRTITLEKQVVLHAKSGLGKSSLLAAGVIPRLLKEGHLQPLRIRFGAYRPGESLSLRQTLMEQSGKVPAETTKMEKISAGSDTLWYFFKRLAAATHTQVPFLLVLDQFEEVFTYPKSEVRQFKRELADLLHNVIPRSFRDQLERKLNEDPGFMSDDVLREIYEPLDIKAVFTIRSDKLSLLDQFKDVMPEILSRTYKLSALSSEQAEEAIINPAYQRNPEFASPQFDYTDEALDAILEFLTKEGDQEVESFQLQVICQSVEQMVMEEKKKLVARDELGDIGAIFENYYENLIAQLPTEEDRREARRLIEEGLILEEEEIRLSLHQGQIQRDFGIEPALLEKLVNTRLIREEPSARGGSVYELSHDTLIKPILKSKAKRLEQERRELEKEQRKAEAERMEAERQKARRRARYALFTAILGIVTALAMVALALWAFKEKQEAQEATAYALAIQQESDRRAQRLDSLLNVIQDLTARGEISTSDEKRLDTVLQYRYEVDQDVRKQMDKITPPKRLPEEIVSPPVKTEPKEVPKDEAELQKKGTGIVVEKMPEPQQREEAFQQLFDGDAFKRRLALSKVFQLTRSDREVVTRELVQYALNNLDNEDGIAYTLYVLDQLPPEELQRNRTEILELLTTLRERRYSATNVRRLKSLWEKLR